VPRESGTAIRNGAAWGSSLATGLAHLDRPKPSDDFAMALDLVDAAFAHVGRFAAE
jgi:hypothetical protein